MRKRLIWAISGTVFVAGIVCGALIPQASRATLANDLVFVAVVLLVGFLLCRSMARPCIRCGRLTYSRCRGVCGRSVCHQCRCAIEECVETVSGRKAA